MNKIILFGLLVLGFNPLISAQKVLSDQFIRGTTLIKYSQGGSASGVIVADSNYLYLITARHCLVKDFTGGRVNLVDSILILIHYPADPFTTKADTLLVNLNISTKSQQLLFDPIQDIAIVSIAKVIGFTPSGNNIFNYISNTIKLSSRAPGGISKDLLIEFDKVGVGDDCFIFGFPSSLQLNSQNDYDFDRPLLRKGAIAGKNLAQGTIIVDCPVYQGNSGGPVFSSNILISVENTGLIGIVSRSILHVETLQSNYYRSTVSVNYTNSGYTVVVPIEYALQLMKKHFLLHK